MKEKKFYCKKPIELKAGMQDDDRAVKLTKRMGLLAIIFLFIYEIMDECLFA